MKRTIVLVISVLVGLVAAVMTRFYIVMKENEVEAYRAQMVARYGEKTVLVFSRDIPSGTILEKSDLGLRTLPSLGLSEDQVLTEPDADTIVGKRLLFGHSVGEPVFWNDIDGGNPRSRGLAADIKGKMRAISINCSGAASVSGMIRPNDHVDVIGTFSFPDDDGRLRSSDIETMTILQNVLVLATGQTTAKNDRDDGGFNRSYSTVTLQVSPREAEVIVFAEQMKSRLVLTLRSETDTTYEAELPKIDYEKVKAELEELNEKRQRGLENNEY